MYNTHIRKQASTRKAKAMSKYMTQAEVVAVYKSGDKSRAYAEFVKSTRNGASFEKFCAAMERMLAGWKA